jgi:tight adherence protein B
MLGPRGAGDRRAAELEWVEGLAAELSAGRDPVSALVAASAGSSPAAATVCPHAVAAARSGADVAPALHVDGARSELVRGVAACWEVASGSGAGLAASLVVLADAARETERVRHELRAGLAEPRATAVVLAALPALGLFLGSMLGAEPLRWLVGSRLGLLVLLAGLVLEGAGAWWAWRIAASLEAQL